MISFTVPISFGGLQLRSGVGDFKLRIAFRTSSWLIRLKFLPVRAARASASDPFPRSSLALGLFSLSCQRFSLSSFCFSVASISATAATTGLRTVGTSEDDASSGLSGKDSGEVVSLPLLMSTGRLKRRVRRVSENRSNWPSPSTSCSVWPFGCAAVLASDSELLVSWILRQELAELTVWSRSRLKLFRIEGGVSMLSESISILLLVFSS